MIVGRQQDFAAKLALAVTKNSKKKRDEHAKEKLVLLLERALLSLSYQDLTKLAPDHSRFVEQDIEWLGRVEALRRKRLEGPAPAAGSTVCAFNSHITHTLHQNTHPLCFVLVAQLSESLMKELSEILSDLPYQVAPTDAISVVERTISRLCTLGKQQFCRPLSADDVIPLLVDVVLRTDLPGLHETLFFMTHLAQEQFRCSSVFGWSLVACQSAIEQIKAMPDST